MAAITLRGIKRARSPSAPISIASDAIDSESGGRHDLSGWTAKDLINPDDITLISRGMMRG